MKILALYKSLDLQMKGAEALARYKPTSSLHDGLPSLIINVPSTSTEILKIIQELKKTSKPFLIDKNYKNEGKEVKNHADVKMSIN